MSSPSASALQGLFEQAEDGILILDSALRVRHSNEAARRIARVDRNPAGELPWIVLPACGLEENCRRAIARQAPVSWEIHTDRWMSFRALPSPQGGLHIWIRDTIQLTAGTEAIFANMSDGVFISDCAGNIVSMNPAALAMTGYARVEEVRGNLAAFPELELRTLDGRMLPAADWPLARILRGETISALEVEIHRQNSGRRFILSCGGAIARDASGAPRFAILIARDITEQKIYERALRSSEERRLLALEAAGMGAWNREVETGAINLSPRCREIFGLQSDTPFHLTDFLNAMHPDDRPHISGALERAIVDRADYDGEFRLFWPDGSEHWIASRGRASYDSHGHPSTIQGVLLDVTKRKRTEEALHQSTGAFRTLVDASPLAIFTVDSAGLTQTWSAAAEKIFGWTESEVLGGYAPCVPDDKVPQHLALLARVTAGETVAALQRTARAKSGEPVLVSFSAAPLREAAGRVYGAVFVLQDVTAARAIEQKLQHAQKLESLGVLAGGVAHDFNNLLTGILGNATLAMDGMREENPHLKMLADIVRASERAADLTRQLLAYAGKGRFITQSLDLSRHVKEIGTLIHSSIARKVHVVRDLPPDLPLIEGDPSQIQQIVMNLVINAAESIGDAETGTVLVLTRSVQVDQDSLRDYFNGEAAAPGPYVSLQVHDTGCGMDEVTRLRIFDPFFSTKFTGRGLGLSAVLGIVRGHRGALRVTSVPGEGTSFTVLFPASGAAPQPSHRGEAETAILMPGEACVDLDEPLRVSGFRALAAHRGDALSAIVLDLESEDQLARWQQSYPLVPILAAVPCSDVEAIRMFPGCRAAGFIRKPYAPAQLIRKLRTILA
jgi:two-component system cell cycle sensor histidine kinase/response regulator CckA